MSSHIVPPKAGCDCFDLDRDNDVDEDDLRTFLADNNYNENSYHVVTGSGTDTSAVLDGFTISAGNANGLYHDRGGGMYNDSSSPTLTNCTFNGNSAHYGGGGGMYNREGSSPTLVNCTFSANSASTRGGGIFNSSNCRPTFANCTFSGNSTRWGGGMGNSDASPKLINCDFTGNSAGNDGGGMYNLHCIPTIDNCTFSDNLARWGGGMSNEQNGDPALTNCTFSGNSASDDGGGMYNYEARPTFANCIFSGNSASDYGGGMYNFSNSRPTLANCMFNGNSAYNGGGMYNYYRSNPTLRNCTFIENSADWRGGGMSNSYYSRPILTNCIFWADVPREIYGGTPNVTYSDVQGGWPGYGNIDADPCFVEPGYWDANGVWVDGDYHLLTGSPCIDSGYPNYIAEPNETDLDGKPRVNSGRIDMGAYEAPILAEARILPRTINLASKGKLVTCHIWLPEGYNVADIDPNSVLLEDEIKPEQFSVDEHKQVATATFDREKVQGILNVGDIELTITCQLTDGTYFEATDTIRVTDKASQKAGK
jgi:parallel beta-helix repeat protein